MILVEGFFEGLGGTGCVRDNSFLGLFLSGVAVAGGIVVVIGHLKSNPGIFLPGPPFFVQYVPNNSCYQNQQYNKHNSERTNSSGGHICILELESGAFIVEGEGLGLGLGD